MKYIVVNLRGNAEAHKCPAVIEEINGGDIEISINITNPDFEELNKLHSSIHYNGDDATIFINHDYSECELSTWNNVNIICSEIDEVFRGLYFNDAICTWSVNHIVDGNHHRAVCNVYGFMDTANSDMIATISKYLKPRIVTVDDELVISIATGINITFPSGGSIHKVETIEHYLNQLKPLTEPCTWKRDEDRKIRTLANRLSGLLRDADPMKASDHYYSVDHVIWMLNEIRYSTTMTHTDKHRWIGWIQCLLDTVYGLTNVDYERNATRVIIKGS